MFQKAFDNVKIEESESGFSSAIARVPFVGVLFEIWCYPGISNWVHGLWYEG